MASTEIKGALAVVVRMAGEALAFRETNGKSEAKRDERYAEDEKAIADLAKLIQKADEALAFIGYDGAGAEAVKEELRAAIASVTGEAV